MCNFNFAVAYPVAVLIFPGPEEVMAQGHFF